MKDLPTPEDVPETPKLDEIQFKSKTPALIASLPKALKDPKNYIKVERALLETLSCGKSHSDPAQMLHCAKCTENAKTRRELMWKFGFRSTAQYMAWKKIHQEIKKRVPLDKYNKMINED